ncbi:uncharacterized protein F5Z01DRAFT_632285 [Emericellopsis atlantica]|uniref:Uncharacterized protein n=1 Tax=Emericellopsis atlantica TaxID=2614577 RepID=A0A9P8CY53_9HYPO|nr:uncharacterized protein F5Z01DRAFT_632285 [Emericellopsis atlantica]KAG9259216.1 hypothetical protein F5Z01DRAFT_632285 [Emericellopsis atlantica]
MVNKETLIASGIAGLVTLVVVYSVRGWRQDGREVAVEERAKAAEEREEIKWKWELEDRGMVEDEKLRQARSDAEKATSDAARAPIRDTTTLQLEQAENEMREIQAQINSMTELAAARAGEKMWLNERLAESMDQIQKLKAEIAEEKAKSQLLAKI